VGLAGAGCAFFAENPNSCAMSEGSLPEKRMAKKLRNASTILLKMIL
jgi:hypothetical protein